MLHSCQNFITLLFAMMLVIAPPAAGQSNNKVDLSKHQDSLFNIIQRVEKKYQAIELEQNSKKTPYFDETLQVVETTSIPHPVNVLTQYALNNIKPQPNEAKSAQATGIPEGQDLLLSIYIDKFYLADIFAYKSAKGAKISLSDFFKVVDFPILIDFTKKTAQGWFISETNQFELNFSDAAVNKNQFKLTINGQSNLIQGSDFLIEENDIYVEGDVLSNWFNLNLGYNFTDQQINLQPQESLPIQLRIARKNRELNNINESVSVMPWRESSYQIISSPLVDVQLLSSTDDKNNNFAGYSLLGSHDLAYLNADYYIAGDTNKELNNARVNFSKYSGDGKLFGFLPANYFEIGDINPVTITDRYNTNISSGVLLSNSPSRENDNNRININGNVQPGWDVELYRNNILIDKQTSVQNGRYEFNDIDLLYGENNFEMILYGPQGQVEKETKQVLIDKNLLANSEANYAFSISQLGKSLLGIDNFQTPDSEGVLFSGRYSQGITDWFSISLGQSSLLSDNDDNTYNYSLGMDFNIFERLLLNTGANIDHENNLNLSLTAKTSINNHSLFYSFRGAKAGNSQEVLLQTNDNLRRIDFQQLEMSGSLLENRRFRVNYANQLEYENDAQGESSTRISNQLSFVSGQYRLQNALYWQKEGYQGTGEIFNGIFQLQGRIGPVQARLSSSYIIQPTTELTNISTELSWKLFNKMQSNFRLDYSTISYKHRARIGINWQHDIFNLSTYYTYNDDKSWNLGLFLRFGFGYDIDNDRTFMSGTSLTNSGTVNVRVFEDYNVNGKFDEGETLVEGVKIKALQVQRQATSDEDGFALLKNMPNNKITDIIIQPGTLSDPFLIPATKGIAITPRKGFLQTIDYPVITSGEIDGSVYLTDTKNNERPLPYATIQLKDEEGEVVANTQTEFDGYYLFVDLLPGKYNVSITDDYIKKHKLRSSEGLQVNLTAQGDVINGSDFALAQLNFTSGYVVNLDTFDDLKMLQVYWRLIQRRYRAKLKQTAFYVEKENTGRYSLNLAFYPDNLKAYQACEQISEADIQCDVEAFEFASQ
jgi:hypothetical protein